jgi:hypothetical protein
LSRSSSFLLSLPYSKMPPIPITILTGFLGSGKTTLLLNLLPQLLSQNPTYKLALLKNEFGDLAVDSQLASASSIGGVRELLNGCICCNLVGQLDEALKELAVSPVFLGNEGIRLINLRRRRQIQTESLSRRAGVRSLLRWPWK